MTAVSMPVEGAQAVVEVPDRGSSLLRNGHALIAGSAVTSVLGVVYWILAARLYPPETIGLNSAAIFAMTYVSGLSHLNLTSALVRFIPPAGPRAGRLALSSYATSAGVAALLSAGFLLSLRWWFPDLEWLRASSVLPVVFAASAVVWCVFVLQDSVLTGLGRAAVVPIENSLFAVAKIALLVPFAWLVPEYGIFASWILAAVLAVVPTNALLFRRLIPRVAAGTSGREVRLGVIARYVAGDYLGYICWLSATTLMPVLVTRELGEEANAYFSLSWVIAYSLYLVSSGLGVSLLAEGARDTARLAAYQRRVLAHTLRLVGPAVLVGVVAAPTILSLFGPEYSKAGSTTLRLLLLSAIPNCVIAVYVSGLRVQRRVRRVSAVLACTTVLLFGLALPLMRSLGVVGVGIAWLAAQVLVGGAIALRLVPRLRTGEGRPPGPYPARLVALVAGVPAAIADRRSRARGGRRAVAAVMPALAGPALVRMVPTVSEVAVAMVGPAGSPPTSVLKVAQSQLGGRSLARHSAGVAALSSDRRLEGWPGPLPDIVDGGEAAGHSYLVESLMPGVPLADLEVGELREQATARALDLVADLHRRTGEPAVIDSGVFARLIGTPMANLAALAPSRTFGGRPAAVDRLGAELARSYMGEPVELATVHGDLTPGNILVDPDTGAVTGLLDWDRRQPGGLPVVDRLHLALADRCARRGRALGRVVADLLAGAPAPDAAGDLLDRELSALGPDGWRRALLVAWLLHVDNNLTKAGLYARHREWIHTNVDGVLRWL